MAEELQIIFIDVGWGDSILLHATDDKGKHTFGLVDSNDTVHAQSSRLFVKRYFERLRIDPLPFPAFEYVFTTHAHGDHINGIQNIVRAFGTRILYSPVCNPSSSIAFANLRRWARRATKGGVRVAGSVEDLWRNKVMSLPFGPAQISILWPPDCGASPFDPSDENNNSLVLAFTLGTVRLVLTGDCEAKNFDVSKADHVALPQTGLRMIQSPHHGARNGGFDAAGGKPFFDQVISVTQGKGQPLPFPAISCHPRPHGHPHKDIIDEFDRRKFPFVHRTDDHYHLVFSTDGTTADVRYCR